VGQLNGKVGLITGAASGIGATCARMLSREGARLVLTDLDDVTSQQIARETGRIVHESPCQIHGTITTDGATIISRVGAVANIWSCLTPLSDLWFTKGQHRVTRSAHGPL